MQQFTKTIQLSNSAIEEFTDSFSNWAVEYGCNLPCYSIDKIESLIIENLIGSHGLS